MLAAPLRLAVVAGQVPGRPAGPEAGCGELDRHAHQALAGPVDAGLGPGPLARPQRQPAELAQHAADRAVLFGELDRRAHLAEDLPLADHH